jgi:hypothetical protein
LRGHYILVSRSVNPVIHHRFKSWTRNTRFLRLVEQAIPPARRIATLAMVRIPPRPASRRICDIANFCDAAADGFGMMSHWSPTHRRSSARTATPIFAHAAEASMSQLSTVNGYQAPPPRAWFQTDRLSTYSSPVTGCCFRMNGRLAPSSRSIRNKNGRLSSADTRVVFSSSDAKVACCTSGG